MRHPNALDLARRSPLVLFAREWLRSPRKVGAICPSGAALAQTMAALVPAGTGLVIELGAGTGSVTAALLQQGVAPRRIMAIERAGAMAKLLRQRFPEIRVLQEDACQLSSFVPAGQDVDCIVSSIPFVSLPSSVRTSVIQEIKAVLKGGLLIQYTYAWGNACLTEAGFARVGSRLVLGNLPPARVMTFCLNEDSDAC